MQCPRCGSYNDEFQQFCSKCEMDLAEVRAEFREGEPSKIEAFLTKKFKTEPKAQKPASAPSAASESTNEASSAAPPEQEAKVQAPATSESPAPSASVAEKVDQNPIWAPKVAGDSDTPKPVERPLIPTASTGPAVIRTEGFEEDEDLHPAIRAVKRTWRKLIDFATENRNWTILISVLFMLLAYYLFFGIPFVKKEAPPPKVENPKAPIY